MGAFDQQTLINAGIALPAGLAVGGIAAILKRRAEENQLKTEGFIYPEERATLPSIQGKGYESPSKSKPKRKEKAGAVTIGHAIGGTAGVIGGQRIVSDLLAKKKTKLLDEAIAQRDKDLNDLLIQEQAMSAGIPVATMSTLHKAASARKAILDHALVKIASSVFDAMEKNADMPVGKVLSKGIDIFGFPEKQKNVYKSLMLAALLGGGVYGYHVGAQTDPARMMAKSVKDSLKERLTGKDNLMGPMPIHVETDIPAMKPLRPGASSLVDPTRGRDVLEGI